MKILIIEDERKMAQLISDALLEQGYEVECAYNGLDGIEKARVLDYDALLVDIMLPSLDGISLVKKLREGGLSTPVIMISARGEVGQRVEGLDAGADDYLGKPFAMSELLARLRVITRRNPNHSPKKIVIDNLVYDASTREARRGGVRIDLSLRETLLLETLLLALGAPVNRTEILKKVWDYDFDPGTNIVDVYIKRLRGKVDALGMMPLIQTIRGVGYVMK